MSTFCFGLRIFEKSHPTPPPLERKGGATPQKGRINVLTCFYTFLSQEGGGGTPGPRPPWIRHYPSKHTFNVNYYLWDVGFTEITSFNFIFHCFCPCVWILVFIGVYNKSTFNIPIRKTLIAFASGFIIVGLILVNRAKNTINLYLMMITLVALFCLTL